MTTKSLRSGRQLTTVADEFRRKRVVSAHVMLTRHGITRMASIVHTLRHTFGWHIVTLKREPGQMAVYALREQPASWSLYRAAPKSTREVWSCSTCGQTADLAGLTKLTPTRASGNCPGCDARRMFTAG